MMDVDGMVPKFEISVEGFEEFFVGGVSIHQGKQVDDHVDVCGLLTFFVGDLDWFSEI